MKTKDLIAVVLIVMLGITAASAQIGSNYGNPCLNTQKAPNTLKTKKHDTHISNNRFNSHTKARGNGNSTGFMVTNKPKHAKKHKFQTQVGNKKKHIKKANRRRDRGDRE